MRTITVLFFLLAGCAMSPDQVRNATPEVLSSNSAIGPAMTAVCLQRGWERDGGLVGQTLPLNDGGTELLIRAGDYGVIAVYELRPASAGRSSVRMWYVPGYTNWPTTKTLDAQLAGCR